MKVLSKQFFKKITSKALVKKAPEELDQMRSV